MKFYELIYMRRKKQIYLFDDIVTFLLIKNLYCMYQE